jgi:hypothetical protein
MRLNDIIESKQLDELNLGGVSPSGQTGDQPQGMLGKLKLGAQQYLNPNSNVRARAKGISSVAKDANALMTQYQEWVGRTYPDQGTTKENLTAWLTQQRLPVTGRVDALLKSINPPAPQAQPAAPASATATTTTAQPAAPVATPPAQPNQQALKGRLKAGQGLGQQTPGGFGNYVAGSGQRIQGANPDGSPRVANIQRESQGGETVTPIDNKMVSQIISAAVAERNRTGGGAQPASAIPQGQPTTGTGSSSSSSTPTAQLTVGSVVNFYKRLNAAGRQQLRAELDKIDKTPVPESTVDIDSVGYSRFLEIKL